MTADRVGMSFDSCGLQSGHVRDAHFAVSGHSSPLSTTKVVFTSTTFAELTAAGSSPNFGFRTHAAKSFFGDGRNTSVALLLRSFGVLGWLVIVSEPAQFFWEHRISSSATPKVAHKMQLSGN